MTFCREKIKIIHPLVLYSALCYSVELFLTLADNEHNSCGRDLLGLKLAHSWPHSLSYGVTAVLQHNYKDPDNSEQGTLPIFVQGGGGGGGRIVKHENITITE